MTSPVQPKTSSEERAAMRAVKLDEKEMAAARARGIDVRWLTPAEVAAPRAPVRCPTPEELAKAPPWPPKKRGRK